MSRPKLVLFLCAIVLPLGLATPATHGQGAYNKAAFEKAMEGATREARSLLGALVAADWAKARASAEAIAQASKEVAKLTPKAGADRISEFQAYADSLGARASRVAAAAKEKDNKASHTSAPWYIAPAATFRRRTCDRFGSHARRGLLLCALGVGVPATAPVLRRLHRDGAPECHVDPAGGGMRNGTGSGSR
jgi:hypothetical protein